MESSVILILPLLVAVIAAVVFMVSGNGKVSALALNTYGPAVLVTLLVFAREFVKLL